MRRYVKGCFKRVSDDFMHKELLPLKIAFFVHSSTVLVLYPYLTLHMRELGINVEETAIMSAVTPFLAIMMPPFAGMIADRIGNFKVLLAICSALGGLAALLLLLVPAGRVTIPFPQRLVLAAQCSTRGVPLEFTLAEGERCVSNQNATTENKINFRGTNLSLQTCGYLCSVDEVNSETHSKSILANTITYSLIDKESQERMGEFNISGKGIILPWHTPIPGVDVRSFRAKQKTKNFVNTIQAFTVDKFFYPTPGIFESNNVCENRNCTEIDLIENFNLFSNSNNKIIDYNSNIDENNMYNTYFINELSAQTLSNGNEIVKFSVKNNSTNFENYSTNTENNSTNTGNNSTNSENSSTCDRSKGVQIKGFYVANGSSSVYTLESCEKACILTSERSNFCKNKSEIQEFDAYLTFWMYLSIRVLIVVISGTSFAMFEGAVIAILREHNADYGLQRIYASIGGMISSPISGYLIDVYSKGKGYTDFRPAFYFYGLLKMVSALLMLTINLEFKSPAKNVVSDVMGLLKKVEVIALFATCFILGTAWGYIESFLFWLLQDLGASQSLMGVTITVGGIAGIPLLIMSGPIIEHIGHAKVLFIGFVFYSIRLMGYSLITAPWQCLIFEAMESVTSSLSFTAAVTYAAKLSSVQTDSSIQGILGGLYYGVGKGSGSLIGGYLIKFFGTRNTYRIFSVVTLIAGLIYFSFNKFYIQKLPQILDENKKRKLSKDQKRSKILENGKSNEAFDLNDMSPNKEDYGSTKTNYNNNIVN